MEVLVVNIFAIWSICNKYGKFLPCCLWAVNVATNDTIGARFQWYHSIFLVDVRERGLIHFVCVFDLGRHGERRTDFVLVEPTNGRSKVYTARP